jgi:hypothetical protein
VFFAVAPLYGARNMPPLFPLPPHMFLTPRLLWSSKLTAGRVPFAGTVAIMARVIQTYRAAV